MSGGSDEDLLAELAVALGPLHDPPPEVLRAARESYTWRTVDAELAALVYDSVLDATSSRSRSGSSSRMLTFETDAVTIEVEVESGPSGRQLIGQIHPGRGAEIELRSDRSLVASVVADALGRFAVQVPSALGRFALRCRLADGPVVETASTAI